MASSIEYQPIDDLDGDRYSMLTTLCLFLSAFDRHDFFVPPLLLGLKVVKLEPRACVPFALFVFKRIVQCRNCIFE